MTYWMSGWMRRFESKSVGFIQGKYGIGYYITVEVKLEKSTIECCDSLTTLDQWLKVSISTSCAINADDAQWCTFRNDIIEIKILSYNEVVIIGGGVCGCSIAHHLAKQGISSQIIGRDAIASRASGKVWALFLHRPIYYYSLKILLCQGEACGRV